MQNRKNKTQKQFHARKPRPLLSNVWKRLLEVVNLFFKYEIFFMYTQYFQPFIYFVASKNSYYIQILLVHFLIFSWTVVVLYDLFSEGKFILGCVLRNYLNFLSIIWKMGGVAGLAAQYNLAEITASLTQFFTWRKIEEKSINEFSQLREPQLIFSFEEIESISQAAFMVCL